MARFINLLKITFKVLLKQNWNYFLVQNLSWHPLKTSALEKKCRNVNANSQYKKHFSRHCCLSCTFHIQFFFSLEKDKEKSIKNLSKTCH